MRSLALVLLVVCITNLHAADRIYTVDGLVEGEVIDQDVQGVSVKDENGQSVVIPWFEMRVGSDAWEPPQEFRTLSRNTMLGHSRRLRGDLRGCAELYAPIAERLVGSRSAMAAEVFGGLLDEAIVRGDFFDAAVAMFALKGMSANSRAGFDPRFGVHPSVPLLLGSSGHRLEGISRRVAEGSDSASVVLRALEFLEHGATGEELDSLLMEMDSQGRSDRDSKLVLDLYAKMLQAQIHDDSAARSEAREWLARRASQASGEWLEAWCRCAIAASFLRESDTDEMLSRGIVELLHVLIRFDDSLQWSTMKAWALSQAVKALQDDGKYEEATQLLQSFDGTMGTDER